MDIQLEKKALRQVAQQAKKSLSPGQREKKSEQASINLMAEKCWKNAGTVALFVSLETEIDTSFLLNAAWGGRKQVLLPLCGATPGSMSLIPCANREELRVGKYGIFEPPAWLGTGEIPIPDICVMPGLAFDVSGNRLGMGQGYYDRFFSMDKYARVVRIGLCFAVQVFDNVPCTEHDLPVHGIVTEKGMLWTTR